MRMSAQHQIAAAALQLLSSPRVVRQHDARHRGTQSRESLVEIAASAPQIFDARQMYRRRVAVDTNGFIPQYADALSLQGPRHPPVQMPIAAQSQGVAHGEVVVAQDGIDAQGSRQPAQGGRDSVYVAISLVHKIAG